MHELLTKLLLFVFFAVLTACQGNLLPTQQVVNPSVVAAESQQVKALCFVWETSLPSWEDADAEATKDEIDYAIRRHESVCG